MDRKKCIEFFENYKKMHYEANPFIIHPEVMNEAIEFLRQDEKYEEKYKKFKEIYKNYCIDFSRIEDIMDDFEQKYFPKKVEFDYRITIKDYLEKTDKFENEITEFLRKYKPNVTWGFKMHIGGGN